MFLNQHHTFNFNLKMSRPVTADVLEERISMYISAMDQASAISNTQQSSQLQQDIQVK